AVFERKAEHSTFSARRGLEYIAEGRSQQPVWCPVRLRLGLARGGGVRLVVCRRLFRRVLSRLHLVLQLVLGHVFPYRWNALVSGALGAVDDRPAFAVVPSVADDAMHVGAATSEHR